MKTRINLYTSEVKPTLELLSLNFVLFCWACLAIFVFLLWGFMQGHQPGYKAQLAGIQAKHQAKANQLAQLASTLEMRKEDPQLRKQVTRQQDEVKLKQGLLQLLSQQEKLKSRGFSQLMGALAESHQPNIGLSLIQLRGQDIRLEGQLQDASALPNWLAQIGQQTYFSDVSFGQARLYRNDTQELQFVLSSRATDTGGAP